MMNKMKVLWFNWRDIKNPEAGGAEVFTHEVMRRLVKKGYDMTLFTAQFPGNSQNETIDGIQIVRQGGKYSVYSKAKEYYKKNKSNYDFIIDEINGKPFLTPKFVKEKPLLAVIHQVHRKSLFYELPFPLSFITYYYLIGKWLSYYKDTPMAAVSNSTREYLEKFGLTKILMVSEGLNITPLAQVSEKESSPTVVFVGRLKRYKLPDHAIKAFSLIKKEIPDAKMWVIGDGYMRKELEQLRIDDVTFYGRINERLKYELLSRAHLILVPSVEEGWGLVVTEANAMGTPAIAYDVAGLRDSVVDRKTGVLVKENSPGSMANNAISLLKDRDSLMRLSHTALKYSKDFSWDKTADEFDSILKSAMIINK